MKLSNKVSFPGERPYEQYSAEFTLEDSDIPKELIGSCNLLEKMFLFNVIVSLEGLLFQYAKGYFSKEEYVAQKDRLVSLLSPKLKGMMIQIMGGKNGNSE